MDGIAGGSWQVTGGLISFTYDNPEERAADSSPALPSVLGMEADRSLQEQLDSMEARHLKAVEDARANPFEMTPEEIGTWLNGGAQPGSMKHEQAKAALAWHTAKMQSDGQRQPPALNRWQKAGIVIAGVTAFAGLLNGLHAVGVL